MESSIIKQQLSGALVSALGEDEADSEDMYTFLIYIHLGILKATNSSVKKALNSATALLNYLNQYPDVNNEDDKDIKLLFENNTDTLVEIIEEVWNTDSYSDELKWMKIWINSCEGFLKQQDFNKAFIQISKLAYAQVDLENISSSVKFLINSFTQGSKKNLSNNKIIRIA